MRNEEVAVRREQAVFALLTAEPGSVLVWEKLDRAVVRTGGLSRAQWKAHMIACLLTLGLWTPVFFVILILRAPKGWIVEVDRFSGEVTVREM